MVISFTTVVGYSWKQWGPDRLEQGKTPPTWYPGPGPWHFRNPVKLSHLVGLAYHNESSGKTTICYIMTGNTGQERLRQCKIGKIRKNQRGQVPSVFISKHKVFVKSYKIHNHNLLVESADTIQTNSTAAESYYLQKVSLDKTLFNPAVDILTQEGHHCSLFGLVE